jgi:predicted dehydrogenase
MTKLDVWRDPEREARIIVEAWLAQERVPQQFVVRPRSPRMVWNYLRRVGPTAVWRKIRSRLAEGRRNERVASVGIGRILESTADLHLAVGQRVAFFAPNHSPDWASVTVDVGLLVPSDGAAAETAGCVAELPDVLRDYAGWSAQSGARIDAALIRREIARVADAAAGSAVVAPWGAERPGRAATDRLPVDSRPDGRPSAVLFGLGNYAKTQVVPHVRRHLRLTTIHEIDPDQIMAGAGLGATLDTSPIPRATERYDAWFIAGYHHTHGPLAVQALEQGAYAVIEKPLVTTRGQFEALRDALRRTGGQRMFGCFHKRYSRLAEWAWADLAVTPGQPVDMYSIVYEIPLPARHWYNWPNSGSRLISNGCHWLDYFLYMNDYSSVREFAASPLRGGDLTARVALENGAQLVMSLTDTGSERLGVRDVIELRARDVTVRLIDATYYDAESSARVLRRGRVNPMDAYRTMYDTICRRIVNGASGDSLASLGSTALMLDLEGHYQGQRETGADGARRPPALDGSAMGR